MRIRFCSLLGEHEMSTSTVQGLMAKGESRAGMNEVLLFPIGGVAAGQVGQDTSSLQLLSLPCQGQV